MEKYGVRTTAKKMLKTKNMMRLVMIGLLVSLLLLSIAYATVWFANQAGRFTVNLDPEAFSKYGLSISENWEFNDPTVMLEGSAINNMDNITESWLPKDKDLDKGEGSHNGENYIAYTFYIRNSGTENIDYYTSIDITSSALGTENAIRVKVFENGNETTYGKAPLAGTEQNEKSRFAVDKTFLTDEKVMETTFKGFKSGQINRYTVVIWLEGEDPECVDKILGGEVKLSMNFHIIDKEAGTGELV
ncbi:hypothetical protein SDC9_100235 [bioreactor metagenome]|uniref:Uncharacterized protein n=1 Tax=bioreactor metagenome TaxID=1076179 RepID=A0A645AKA3_9ZZZZ